MYYARCDVDSSIPSTSWPPLLKLWIIMSLVSVSWNNVNSLATCYWTGWHAVTPFCSCSECLLQCDNKYSPPPRHGYTSSSNFHFYSQATHTRGAERWLQFPNDAAHASPSFGHSCSALMGFFFFGFCLCLKIKSCNLKSKFCRLHREFHSGAKGLRNRLLSQSESGASQRQLPAFRHETLQNL